MIEATRQLVLTLLPGAGAQARKPQEQLLGHVVEQQPRRNDVGRHRLIGFDPTG
ncbi:hypothetical protein QA634_34855 [Methylobacterium sp. CB376]|uniref:hypothetical protein n=1 Tax=unclassified Methylobacterium TaxID=2615210 RepID=UPI00143B43B2|nr:MULTISPECIES: hypothetical protein [Methylobacterium]WFT80289.1 hypothetical protein QA634_34855 [Methylobacterium nodulans]